MKFETDGIATNILEDLWSNMLRSRMIEERMLVLLRQGKISKWFSGIGQEAISVGVTMALEAEEYILPMHRNLGVFTTRGIPFQRLFAQWQGKLDGFTKGRDRSFHFGSKEHHLVGMISHLGPQFGVANGIALGDLLQHKNQVTAVFTGEGGTSEGDFHEALNMASVWRLPVLFCIENNGYGLSTPTSEQYACEHLADRGKGYGMEAHVVDGNNIVEVYQTVSHLARSMRQDPRPVLLEFKTFRMRGHEEASGIHYVPQYLLDEWAMRDPLVHYQKFLEQSKILTPSFIQDFRDTVTQELLRGQEVVQDSPSVVWDAQTELEDVYRKTTLLPVAPSENRETLRFVDAIAQGLDQAMDQYSQLVLMGQDIAEYGGVFKVSQGLVEKYGKHRVRNTPICESAVVSTAMGLAINGFKAMVEMQFADFVSTGFNPIVNYLAKSHYRWGQAADVVIRLPCGGGVGAGPFHSQTNEAWFTKVPGLKVVYPAFPEDAKGLLAMAIADPNPVLFFEHKGLYRTITGEVPSNLYTIPFGKARLVLEGDWLTVVAYGAAVHWAIEALGKLPDLKADLLDLRTLQPLDMEAIYASVRKTGKLLIVHEDTLFNSMASEISARVVEHCFEYLDAPIKRVGSMETPIPFVKELENGYLPQNRLKEALSDLASY